MNLRIHHWLPMSRANGPGRRGVLWLQGCSLGCPGCFNPGTHSRRGGRNVTIDALWDMIKREQKMIEGITLTGGEPLQQLRPVRELIRRVKEQTALSILLLTGYAWPEVLKLAKPAADGVNWLDRVDVVIAGRYQRHQRHAQSLIGSSNKSVHFLTGRYGWKDLQSVPEAEVLIEAGGRVSISGIGPPIW